MNRNKYRARSFESRFPELRAQRKMGEELEVILAEYPKPLKDLARELSPFVGLNEQSTYQYLLDLRQGQIHGNRSSTIPRGLIRLAITLYHVGVEEDAEIIAKLKTYNARFTYPPKITRLEAIQRRSGVIPRLEEMVSKLNIDEAEQVIEYIESLKRKD